MLKLVEVVQLADKKRKGLSCSDKVSKEYLEVNSCGIERIYKRDRGSDRPMGRSDYQIIYVEKGACNLILNGEHLRLPEGNVVLFRPREPQKYYYLKEDSSVSHFVHFSGTGCSNILKDLGIGELTTFNIGRSRSFEEISERMVQEFVMQNPMYMVWCTSYLYQLLAIVARKYALRLGNVNKKSESRINAACRKIYDNLKNPPSVAELAAENCLSESRFVHLFREVTERSYTDFVVAIRVEKAKELLLGTNMPIREIAEAVGFENQNYFSRCFRKKEGLSPREYRLSENGEDI